MWRVFVADFFSELYVISCTSFLQFSIYGLTEQFEIQTVLSAHNNEYKASSLIGCFVLMRRVTLYTLAEIL